MRRQKLLDVIEEYPIDLIETSQKDEIEFLAGEYSKNNVIPENKKLDALHIAVSTITKVDYLVVGITNI